MQERRLNIRTDHRERAQYCPANDLLPRDGRITNVSERGIGLLTQEPHREGERVTVSFSLADQAEPLTATGVARWSTAEPLHGRWFPIGVEWLPFEDATRNRMRSYLEQRQQRPVVAAAPAKQEKAAAEAEEAPLDRMLVRAAAIAGVIASIILALWSRHLHQQTQQLGGLIRERTLTITSLQAQTLDLEGELDRAKTGLAATIEEVSRLDRQNQDFALEMARMNQGLESIRLEYARLRDDYAALTLERTELSHKLRASEQEKLELAYRLTSLPELRKAIREASGAARGGSRNVRVQTTQPAHTAQESESSGWIRVHEPEVYSSPSSQLGP